jgi:predicted MPP superfamily phosphohydrolase
MLYRLSFFVVMPVRGIVILFIKRVHHHWPLAHVLLITFGAPFFYYGLYHACKALWRRRQARRGPAPVANAAVLSRRAFLGRSAGRTAGFTAAGFWSYGVYIVPGQLQLREYELPIVDLPPELDGLRVVHVSDTHYGPFVTMAYLRKVIARVNELKPDLITLTGDYVHWTPEAIEPGIGVLAELKARLGVVAVLGNHEHWEGADRCREVFKKANIPLVDNGRAYLTPAGLVAAQPIEPCLCVAGLGDLWEDKISHEDALGGVPGNMPRIVLSHNPDSAEAVPPEYRIDLMLCGHTHGGQISLPIIGAPAAPIRYKEKYLGGLCEGPHFPVVVSRGAGLAGVPIRLGVPPEIGLITLSRV